MKEVTDAAAGCGAVETDASTGEYITVMNVGRCKVCACVHGRQNIVATTT